jgi:hypothetical protein
MNNFKLDIDTIKKRTSNKYVKVQLKKHPIKGIGLYATQNIQKNEVIAHYKITVYLYKNYDSPTKNVYTFNVYRKNGTDIKKYIGDISNDSFVKPVKNISFLAPFANEPSIGEKSNAEMELNLENNYKDRSHVNVGDTLIYNLVAIRDIKKGEEILWYYGEQYNRDYKVSKK